jgi:hypothetical protein
MTYTPEGDRLHALFIKGLERQQAMTDTSEHQDITNLRQTMADRADKVMDERMAECCCPQCVTDRVTDAILRYATHCGQPLTVRFAVQVAQELADKGLLADD